MKRKGIRLIALMCAASLAFSGMPFSQSYAAPTMEENTEISSQNPSENSSESDFEPSSESDFEPSSESDFEPSSESDSEAPFETASEPFSEENTEITSETPSENVSESDSESSSESDSEAPLETTSEPFSEESSEISSETPGENASEYANCNDLEIPEAIEVPEELRNSSSIEAFDEAVYADYATSSEWDIYSNYYYYNKLNSSEKALWDRFASVSNKLLTTTDNVTTQYKDSYYTSFVPYTGVTKTRAIELAYIFMCSNPQYYFLKSGCMYYENAANGIALKVYQDFANGGVRKTATAKFKTAISLAMETVNAQSNDYLKEKVAHDYIVNHVTYEKTGFHQSAYGALVSKKCVCSGYAEAMSLLCNAAGIDCVTTESPSHRWNKVLIYGSWYVVDCTWDDPVSATPTLRYSYFNRSDAKTLELDTGDSHKEKDSWKAISPVCLMDSKSDYDTPGVLTESSLVVAMPEYTITPKNGKFLLTFTNMLPGTECIYLTPGGDGEVAAGRVKANYYKNGITLTKAANVKMIFYAPGYTPLRVNPQFGTFHVNFNPCGGTFVNPSDEFYYYKMGEEKALPGATKLARTGFEFNGWFKSADYKGSALTKISKTVCGDLDLYAKWTPVPYKVVYHANGGSGTMSSSVFTYGTEGQLRLNTFKRTGYRLAGWNTKADGSGEAFLPEAAVLNLSVKKNEVITLYAQWEPVKYNIYYHLSGSTFSDDNYPKNFTILSPETKLASPEVPYGYRFAGWFSDNNLKKEVTSVKPGSIGDIHLYAKVVPCTYTISYHVFDENGMEVDAKLPDGVGYFNQEMKLPESKVILPGKGFYYWYAKTENGEICYYDGTMVIAPYVNGTYPGYNQTEKDGHIDLYAYYSDYYKVNLMIDGADFGDASQTEITTHPIKYGEKFVPATPVREGYTFKGWVNKETGKKVSYLKQNTGGDVNLLATWKENKYRIVYVSDAKGSSGSVKAATVSYTDLLDSFTLAENGFTRKGYGFTGWSVLPESACPVGRSCYMPGEQIGAELRNSNLIPQKDNSQIKIYATWEKALYRVHYQLSDAIFPAGADVVYTYQYTGTSKTVYELATPVRKASTFAGWYADEALTKKVVRLTGNDFGDKILYPKWVAESKTTKAQGTIDFYTTDMLTPEYSMDYSSITGVPAKEIQSYKPVRAGYDFAGWYREPECKHKVSSIPANTTGNINLYAKFTGKKINITFQANAPEGTKCKGSMGKLTYVYGTKAKLRKSGYKIPGYTLKGFATAPNGLVRYLDGGIYPGPATYPESGAIILYAVWEIDTYQITYETNGGTFLNEPVREYHISNAALDLPEPVRAGYTFLGWYRNKNLTGKITSVKAESTGDLKLYAKWKRNW